MAFGVLMYTLYVQYEHVNNLILQFMNSGAFEKSILLTDRPNKPRKDISLQRVYSTYNTAGNAPF